MARLAFGDFELDPTSGELWKAGACLRIQEQPLKLLLCLLERPGQLVGREELQKRVWTGGIHVGFEDGLNAAAWRLRQALGDSAERPQFIETVPRKGYRFVGRVTPLPGSPRPPSASFPMPVYRPDSGWAPRPALPARRGWEAVKDLGRSLGKAWMAGALGLVLLGAGALVWGAFRTRTLTVALTPLVNGTGDLAVDYFASALGRQVAQDLAATRELRVLPAESSGPRGAQAADLVLTWTLARDAQGYRIAVHLTRRGGQGLGDQVFLSSPENLHEAHQGIATYLVGQALGRASDRALPPQGAEPIPAAGAAAGSQGRP
ncbi:winged helix-turn-helix domain-containing protein [Geothrix sp.]|jgi:DNA-binding winged helix-turn-helix (wHTH) protein|uniref:winged helix-turn-helix domain-containing protein n=1 Tax=Geothrix sp. TaxID=1962974 RepID=UPI0025C13223|nr:winged helix-turn-helix domain-containing protein [Geothrix sp.]